MAAVAITAYASAIVGLVRGWLFDSAYLAMVREEVTTGAHHPPAGWRVLTTAFFHHPAQLAGEIEAAGLRHETTLGIQGPGWLVPEFEASWEDASRRATLLEIARLVERDPVQSPHMVAFARKP